MPGRGFILNNELTDFTFEPADPTVPSRTCPRRASDRAAACRRRSCCDDGAPVLALGSPGGAHDHHDRAPDAGEPHRPEHRPRRRDRRSPRKPANAATADAEPAFLERYGDQLESLGHAFAVTPEIGAATGVEFLPGGVVLAAAETAAARRGERRRRRPPSGKRREP